MKTFLDLIKSKLCSLDGKVGQPDLLWFNIRFFSEAIGAASVTDVHYGVECVECRVAHEDRMSE